MKLLKSFLYAFKGIGYCISNERNMRIHIVIGAYVLFFAQFFNFSSAEWCVLIFTVSSVLIMEMVNTAVERLCDLYTKDFNRLIKIIKDVSAGAVLVCATGAAFVGFFLFWQPLTIWNIILHLCCNPLLFTIFILTLVICILFIAVGPRAMLPLPARKNKNTDNNKNTNSD